MAAGISGDMLIIRKMSTILPNVNSQKTGALKIEPHVQNNDDNDNDDNNENHKTNNNYDKNRCEQCKMISKNIGHSKKSREPWASRNSGKTGNGNFMNFLKKQDI